MNFDATFTLEQLTAYLAAPAYQRPFARYREDLLEPDPAFTPAEAARLADIARVDVPTWPRCIADRLLVDLSWASAHLEGTTYTHLQTQALIERGQSNAGQATEDAALILNHKRATEYMLAHAVLTPAHVRTIQKTLADNSMAPHSKHFLEPRKCGVIRSYTENGFFVYGSSYFPPQAEGRPHGYIEQEFERLLASANALPDAINQSFFVLTRIPYLQAFYNASKRTARISCNIPLIAHGLAPLSFIDFEKKRYLEGMITFNELGDERLAKSAYLDAYLASALRYLPPEQNAHPAPLATLDQRRLAAARRYVLDGGGGGGGEVDD